MAQNTSKYIQSFSSQIGLFLHKLFHCNFLQNPISKYLIFNMINNHRCKQFPVKTSDSLYSVGP